MCVRVHARACVGMCVRSEDDCRVSIHLCLLVYSKVTPNVPGLSWNVPEVEQLLSKAPLAAEPSHLPVNTFKKVLKEILKVNLFTLFWVYVVGEQGTLFFHTS